jgi:regulation of enolase protein 1 (concanavalin A-like superfamily)
MIAAHPAAAQTSALPSGWTHADIGSPAVAGSAGSVGDTITVSGAGADVGGSSDEFHFAYQEASGDADFRVRVAALQNASADTKAGLMIRESLADDAQHAFMFVSAGQGLAFQRRTKDGRASVQVSGPSAAPPVWLRLVRKGNIFTAYSSSTGAAWTLVGSARVNMNARTYIGLAVTSHVPTQAAAAAFTNLSSGFSSSLPIPWTAADIGSPLLSGAAAASAGTFTLAGTGRDIWGTSDQFQYVYRPVTGDTEIVAWIAGLQAADGASKAGIMIRENLQGPAAHASMFVTGSNGWTFQQRFSPGAVSYSTTGSAGGAPGWVRLVREGNLFSAYQSEDGSLWTFVGSDTIAMPATVYVGLAVTSHVVSATATATISNVAISTPTSINKPPSVSFSAPVTGANFTAPANIAMAATAGDVDGSVSRVDFYAGPTLLSSDTTAPFATTWSSVAAGTYTLTAVATDNDGHTGTSAAVTVTVGAAANRPPTVSISAPITGASYTAPATIGISATAADPDGTVARVDFYAGTTLVASDSASPFSATWSNVAAGTYSLTAVATDNAGARTTSSSIAVTVGATPAIIPSTLVFGAPTDYASNVTSCTVELRRATDVVTATPVATRILGKPATVAGDISVDISTLVNPLAAGSYYAIVLCTGPGGSTRSSPSAVFSK